MTGPGRAARHRRCSTATRRDAAQDHAVALLNGFTGVLQTDGYAAYQSLADPKRAGGPVTLAHCWAHCRRKFFDIAKNAPAPIATEALKRIAEFYAIEAEIRGRSADERRAVRQKEDQAARRSAEGLAREDPGAGSRRIDNRQGDPLCPQPLGRAGAFPR